MEIQQSILSLLKQQLEVARLEELDNSGMLQIIDPAEIPEKRAEPSRAMIGVVAAVAGLCLGILAAIIAEYAERTAHDPAEAEALEALRSILKRRRRRHSAARS